MHLHILVAQSWNFKVKYDFMGVFVRVKTKHAEGINVGLYEDNLHRRMS